LQLTAPSFLIVKIAAIGDVVMALPMLSAICGNHPEASITWVCGNVAEPILRRFSEIDELIVVDEKKLIAGNVVEKILALLALWLKLWGRRFDFVLTGHADRRYRLLTVPVRAETRRSFSHTGRRWPVPGRYHADEYVRLVTGIDSGKSPRARMLTLRPSLPATLDQIFQGTRRPVVAVAPGGARNLDRDDRLRRWPIDMYKELCKRLVDAGCSVVLTGATSDKWALPHLADIGCTDLIGKSELVDLLGIYARSDLVITNDSGPLHLAELAGARVIALFGPTNPSEKVLRDERTTALWGGERLPCRPCYDGKSYAPCEDNVCMKAIPVDEVYQAALSILRPDQWRESSG
jgi:heptosyltransferase-2